jgi:hypothetical protein
MLTCLNATCYDEITPRNPRLQVDLQPSDPQHIRRLDFSGPDHDMSHKNKLLWLKEALAESLLAGR